MDITYIRQRFFQVEKETDLNRKVDKLTEIVGELLLELQERDRRQSGRTGYSGSVMR